MCYASLVVRRSWWVEVTKTYTNMANPITLFRIVVDTITRGKVFDASRSSSDMWTAASAPRRDVTGVTRPTRVARPAVYCQYSIQCHKRQPYLTPTHSDPQIASRYRENCPVYREPKEAPRSPRNLDSIKSSAFTPDFDDASSSLTSKMQNNHQSFHERQPMCQERVEDQYESDNGKRDQRAMPPLIDVIVVIEHDETLNLCSGEERSNGTSTLPGEGA